MWFWILRYSRKYEWNSYCLSVILRCCVRKSSVFGQRVLQTKMQLSRCRQNSLLQGSQPLRWPVSSLCAIACIALAATRRGTMGWRSPAMQHHVLWSWRKRGFAKGVSRTVSPLFFWKWNRWQRKKGRKQKKGKKSEPEKNSKKGKKWNRKKKEENGQNWRKKELYIERG